MFKLSLLILLLLSEQLFAQTLTLSDAIAKAMRTHPDIRKFSLQVQKTTSGVDIAQADYLPQLNFNAEYDPSKTYVLPQNGIFHTINDDGYQVGASLQQKIWDFDKTVSNIDAQKVSTDIAKLSLTDAKAYLAYKVKLQYELILVQRSAILVRKKDLEAKEALYKQAQALVVQGMKTSADATRFLSSFYVAKDNLAISQANFDKARTKLSIYINEEIPSDIILDETMLNKYQNLDEQTILQNSPSLKALQKGVEKSSLEYQSAKASHYGSLDLIASYSYQNSLNKFDSTLVGLQFGIPIYSGGRISAFAQEAEINKQSAQTEYDSKVLTLKDEVSSLIIDIKRYKKTIDAKMAQLHAATSTSELLEARYKEGLATYIEVLDASALRLDAELGLLSARYERSSAIHKLEYFEGKTNE